MQHNLPLRTIERPRLIATLDACEAPIILICGPPGYGKSVLARQWLADKTHTWLHVSTQDQSAPLLPRLTQDPKHRDILTSSRFLNELHAPPRGLAEVVEAARHRTIDLEDLYTPPQYTNTFCIDDPGIPYYNSTLSLPDAVFAESSRLVILARRPPEWLKARDLLYGIVALIGPDDLAFTATEIDRLVGREDSMTSKMHLAFTGGWPTMVLQSLNAHQRRALKASTPLHHTIRAFLEEELIPVTPDALWRAAELLAPLDEWDQSHLTAVTSSEGLDVSTEQLEWHGLTRRLQSTSSQQMLAVHPIIRNYFSERSIGGCDSSTVTKACRALVDIGATEQASRLALSTKASPIINTFAVETLDAFLSENGLLALKRFLSAASRYLDPPTTLLYQAEVASRTGDLEAALTSAIRCAEHPTVSPALAARSLAVAGRSAHLMRREAIARDLFERAARIEGPHGASGDVAWGLVLTAPKKVSAEAIEELSKTHAAIEESPKGQLRSTTALYAEARRKGSMRGVLITLEAGLPLVAEVRDPMATSAFLHAYTSTLTMASEYNRALASLETALELAHVHRLQFALGHLHVTEALCHIGTGRSDLARSALAKAASAPLDQASREFVSQNCTAALARLYLSEHQASAALSLTTREWPNSSDPLMVAELIALRALTLRLSGNPHESEQALNLARSIANPVEVVAISILSEMITALQQEQLNERLLLVKVRELLQIGMEDTLLLGLRVSEDLSTAIQNLATSRVISRPSRILMLLEQLAFDPHTTADRHSNISVFDLTLKETAICELLRSGLSNKAIAKELFLAESTVKLHLRNIFRKLGVSSRTQGVLKLIEAEAAGSTSPAK